MHPLRRASPVAATLSLMLVVTACSATDPVPSPRFDGHYTGTRESDKAEACGVTATRGTTSASISGGHITMPLFGPKTPLTGSVGDDGTVRASGIWRNPTGGFPGETVLDARIRDDLLDGTATDFRCSTVVHLRRSVRQPKPQDKVRR